MAVAGALTSGVEPDAATGRPPTDASADAPADAIVRPGPPARGLWQRDRWLWLAQAVALLALTLGLWSGCLRLYTLHNDFPAAYHPDERGKGYQLITGERNFNHPQLMLETALLLTPVPQPAVPSPQGIDAAVRRARLTSAAFGAGAAVLLAWAGFAAAGWAGFLCVGLAVGLCPALLAHAHYFKEDPSLVFGVSAVLCAAAWALRVRGQGPQLWTVIALGVGCGLAAAGKYCGAVMLGPAIVVALAATLRRRHWALAAAGPLLVTLAAAGTWAAVDFRVFTDFDHFLQSFSGEEAHSTGDHFGLTMDRPNSYFIDHAWREAAPDVKGLAVVALPALGLAVWRRRAGWTGAAFGVWLALTAAVYSVMLAYSVIPFFRYALPVSVMLCALAGLAAAWAAMLPRRAGVRAACVAGMLLLIGAGQGWRCADYTNQFADDSRDALRAWVRADLPPGTAVAADNYAALGADDGMPATPIRLVRTFVPAAMFGGSVDGLREDGVQYVVTAGSTSDRYADPRVHAEPSFPAVQRTIDFYRDLRRYPVVWRRVAAHPMWTFANPDIVVYRIDAPLR